MMIPGCGSASLQTRSGRYGNHSYHALSQRGSMDRMPSRRRFLATGAAVGASSLLAGCNTNFGFGPGSSTRLPGAISAELRPTETDLIVTLVFEGEVEPALTAANTDATTLVETTPSPTRTRILRLDSPFDGAAESDDGDAESVQYYRTQLQLEDVITRDGDEYTTPQVAVTAAVRPVDGWGNFYTFSAAVLANTSGSYDAFPDGLFTFPVSALRRMNRATMPEYAPEPSDASQFKTLWDPDPNGHHGIAATTFPAHEFDGGPENVVPPLHYWHAKPFPAMLTFQSVKLRYWELLEGLIGSAEANRQRAWESTTDLVHQTFRSVLGQSAPTDFRGTGQAFAQGSLELLYPATQVVTKPASVLVGALQAQQDLKDAAAEYQTYNRAVLRDVYYWSSVYDTTGKRTAARELAQFERETVLPSLTLSRPVADDIDRRDVWQYYDRLLDAERTLLSELIDDIAAFEEHPFILNSYSRALLYEDATTSPLQLVDVTSGRAKHRKTTTVDTPVAPLSPFPLDRDTPWLPAEHTRIARTDLGYDIPAERITDSDSSEPGYYRGIRLDTPVAVLFRELAMGSNGVDPKDVLPDAKALVAMLELLDQLLRLNAIQQQALQYSTNLYTPDIPVQTPVETPTPTSISERFVDTFSEQSLDENWQILLNIYPQDIGGAYESDVRIVERQSPHNSTDTAAMQLWASDGQIAAVQTTERFRFDAQFRIIGLFRPQLSTPRSLTHRLSVGGGQLLCTFGFVHANGTPMNQGLEGPHIENRYRPLLTEWTDKWYYYVVEFDGRDTYTLSVAPWGTPPEAAATLTTTGDPLPDDDLPIQIQTYAGGECYIDYAEFSYEAGAVLGETTTQ